MTVNTTTNFWRFYRRAAAEGDLNGALLVAEKAALFYRKAGDFRQAAIFERAVSSTYFQRGDYIKAARLAKRSCRNLSDPYEKALAYILSG